MPLRLMGYAVYMIASFWLGVFGVLSWAWFLIGMTLLLVLALMAVLNYVVRPRKRSF